MRLRHILRFREEEQHGKILKERISQYEQNNEEEEFWVSEGEQITYFDKSVGNDQLEMMMHGLDAT